jgi:gliding motility-associated-like protein
MLCFKIADVLQPSDVVEFIYRAKAVKPGKYVNWVYLSCLDDVDEPYEASASATVVVMAEKDLEITKVCSVSEIIVNESAVYTLTVKAFCKPGAVLRDVVVYDTLPNQSMLVYSHKSSSVLVDRVDANRGVYKYTIGDMTVGDEDVVITMEVIHGQEGVQVSCAGVISKDYEYDLTNNVACARVFVGGLRINVTTITPNDDGINDNFEIPLALSYPDNEIFIFNRVGNLVYTKRNYYNEFNAKGLPDGTYYYLFSYRDASGKTSRISGPINVLRPN